MRTSYSALETFQNCPQKYKFQEIDKIKVSKSAEAIFGNIIHNALKYMHSQEPLYPSLDQILEYYKKDWPNENKVEWREGQEKAYFEVGLEMLRGYYRKNDPRKTKIVDLESRFEVEIPNEENSETHILAGKIDRIDKLEDDAFEIIDYKTAKKMPPQNLVDNNLQLSLYHLALTKKWPHIEPSKIKLSLYFLKHGVKLTTQMTKNRINETKQKILDSISEIEKSDFHPTPGPLCEWCGYKPICPMWKHQYENQKVEVKSQNEIKETIEEYFEIKKINQENEKRLTKLKEMINQYLDEEKLERVFGDAGFITRSSQKRYKYDFKSLKNILEPLNKWKDILTIDSAKLKKVLGKVPWETKKEIYKARKLSKEFKVLQASINKKVAYKDESN